MNLHVRRTQNRSGMQPGWTTTKKVVGSKSWFGKSTRFRHGDDHISCFLILFLWAESVFRRKDLRALQKDLLFPVKRFFFIDAYNSFFWFCLFFVFVFTVSIFLQIFRTCYFYCFFRFVKCAVFIDSPDFPYVLFLLLLMRRWPKSFPIPFHLPQHGVKDLKWQIWTQIHLHNILKKIIRKSAMTIHQDSK